MVGENIKKFRIISGFTQKDLAEKLFVTSQAVSRWENGEVEPSITTLTALSDIFNVSIDEIIGRSKENPVAVVEDKEEANNKLKEEITNEIKAIIPEHKTMLALCSECNEPIYNKNDIVRLSSGRREKIVCSKCDKKIKERARNAIINTTISRRRKSYVVGALAFAALFAIFIYVAVSEKTIALLFPGLLASYGAYALIGCLFIPNNFIGDMVEEIIGWGFVRMPGIIFELDIDGIVWAIGVKIAFFILGLIISFLAFLFAVGFGMVVSAFVYPFALAKSYARPDYKYL